MAKVTKALSDKTSSIDRLALLFDTQHQRIYRLARRLCRDPEEARDLLQETFLRAARKAHALPESRPAAEAWLVRTAIHLCRDLGRRQAVRARYQHKLDPSQLAVPDPEAATVARTSVATALAKLSPRRRAIVVMVELEGLTSAEVARLLGVREGTVRWHLSKGRRELKDRLTRKPAAQGRHQ